MDEKELDLDKVSVTDPEPEEGEGREPETPVEGENKGASEPATPDEADVMTDPPRVPYSRFETVNERAIRAEAELELLKQQREDKPDAVVFTGDLPEKWVRLYGDNDASREAYGLYKTGIKEEFQSMRQDLLNEVRAEERRREVEAEKEANEWATKISDYGLKNARSFTDAEQSALLDVMDELAPKDDKGMYLVSPISYLPQAVELYDLRNQKANFSKKEAKRKATEIAGAKGEGEPEPITSDSHFRPGQWDSWRNNPIIRG